MRSLPLFGRLFSGLCDVYNDLNPATLNGAIDVVVVEDGNGDLRSGPFHVRFGKIGAINPANKQVEVFVNGRCIEAIHMRLGGDGIAYFVDNRESLYADSDSETQHLKEFLAFNRAHSADNINEQILTTGRGRRRGKKRRDTFHSEDHPDEQDAMSKQLCVSDSEMETRYQEAALGSGDLSNTKSDNNTFLPNAEGEEADLIAVAPADVSPKPVQDGVYLEDLVSQPVDENIKQAYLYGRRFTDIANHPGGAIDGGYKSDSDVGYVKHTNLQISVCPGLTPSGQVDHEKFCAGLVTLDDFAKDPAGVLANPNLVLCFEGKFYNWQTAAPMIISRLCFQTDLPYASVQRLEQAFMPKEPPKRRPWFGWGSSAQRSEPEKPLEPKPKLGSCQPSSASLPVEAARPRRRLVLNEDEIEAMELKPGENNVRFRIITKYQGISDCNAKIYLWRWDEKLIISDVDGTITKSDFLGHFLPIIGRDWTQDGVAEFYTKVAENGYKFVYLSARAIGQSGVTRSYIDQVCQRDKYRLPSGPILLSPSSLIESLHREMIARTPEVFKVGCMRDLKELFGSDANPFYAAFGNRENDVRAYLESGIESNRIFTVNARGELRNHGLPCALSSFDQLNALVDHLFPILPHKLCDSETASLEEEEAVAVTTTSSAYSAFSDVDTSESQQIEVEFSRAAAYLPEIAGSLSSDDLAYFYSRYKQATEGPCNTPQPVFWQYKERTKWNSWKALGDLSEIDAKRQYIQKLTELAPEWSSKIITTQTGPRVSRPMFSEDFNEGDKGGDGCVFTPLIELVKDGAVEPVQDFLKEQPSAVSERDSNGLTPLHWAVDRGFRDIATALLDAGAEIDAQDADKQTSLHYACSCKHRDLAQLLLDRGANRSIKDSDGEIPFVEFLNSSSS